MKLLLNKQKAMNIGKRTVGTLVIPVAVAVLLAIICAIGGVSMFPYDASFGIFIRATTTLMITTIALSINLSSGRFDFSLGSMATLSAVISAKITLEGGGNAFSMLVIALVFGLILGLISGGLYVALNIPPIITSLGVTLLYEGLAFTITGGSSISFYGAAFNVTAISNSTLWLILIMVIVLALIIFIFEFTKFGYNYKALRAGQKISVNTGIKEVPNAIVCYMICGGLMGIVGFINSTNAGLITLGILNFGSIGIMFNAFLPMFIGGFIGRYSNDKLGYLLAALTMSFFTMTYVAFDLKSSTQSIINAVLLVVFLIYLNNEQLIRKWVTLKPLREHLKNKKTANSEAGA